MANVLQYVTANRFYVEIEQTIKASFSECSGLGAKIDHKQYMEGGVNDQQRIYLGQTKFDPVILKRGLSDDFEFWSWISKLWEAYKTRRNVNILVFNQAGEQMQCWTLIGAIPVAWKAPTLKADGNTMAIEQLTLAYEGLTVSKNGGGGATTRISRDDKSGDFSSY
jgi:phage tail-like protein